MEETRERGITKLKFEIDYKKIMESTREEANEMEEVHFGSV